MSYRFFPILLMISFVALATAHADTKLVRDTEARSPQEELQALHVAEGFEIELFAAEPMINKPVNLAVDARGRLWVSSTVEYPYAADRSRWSDEQGTRVQDSRDAIKILEDTDGDGSADKVTNFAEGLNIPTGVLPWHRPEHHDGCIAWSIPNIWYFADTTGDGVCDLREVIFGPLGFEKDTHGMCSSFRMGPDGWVYATHGFNNTSSFEAKDGSTLELHSGNVFRFRPDGSRIELWSAGQVNPFGLCFDGRGNLYSSDCHSAPVYQLLHGAVYPSFGKPHDGLGFGPVMIEHTHGSTGICGISYVDRGVWGEQWNDHVLIGNPVTSRVNFDRIEFLGSTPVAIEQPDFVVSDDPWFRPVDLCMADDGALYIADFYNRIIGHYEVPLDHPGRDRQRGRIWRVTRKGQDPVKRGPVEVPAITDAIVALADDSPFVRRAAAARLQDEPRSDAIGPLTQALAQVDDEDTHLRHALRLAIRENLRLPGAYSNISDGDGEIASISLSVNSQESAGYLELLPLVGKMTDERLAYVARFGGDALRQRWIEKCRAPGGSGIEQADRIVAIQRGLAEGGQSVPLPEMADWAQEIAEQLLAAHEAEGGGMWSSQAHPEGKNGKRVSWVLQKRKRADGREVEVLSSLKQGQKNAEQSTGILRSRKFAAPPEVRFWICGHRGFPGQSEHERNVVRLVDADSGKVLVKAFPPRSDVCLEVVWDLSDCEGRSVSLEVVDGDAGTAYAWLGIADIRGGGLDVESFAKYAKRERALRQLAEVLRTTAPVGLRDRLQNFFPPAPPAPPLEVSPADREKRKQLIAERVAGYESLIKDTANGRQLFRAQCAACHRIAGEGGLIGPQLDGVGARGMERLSEDVLDPHRNVDAHFRITTFSLKDGSATAGFVAGERGEVVVVIDALGNELRIAKADIAQRETSSLSLMPATFGETLTEQQFADLLAWLLEQ